MDPGPIYISSDDELGWTDLDEEDNFDWVSDLLESADKVTDDDDDSDDVVVISEVNSKSKKKSSKRTVADVDDDCVVLDGDPDKPVSVVEDSGSGSDELLVVGEKGQVACRDYPHPRHLCAKFPFKTTRHENHCDLCHCYVCDSLAPCVHWSTRGSNFDHCHATDKEETWKVLRKNFKTAKTAPLSASNNLAPTTHGPVPPLNIIRLAPNSLPESQVSRTATIRPCTSAGRTMPGIRIPSRSHQPEYLFPKNKVQPCSVSKQLLGARTNVVGRNRGQDIGHLGPVSSHSMFKRVGAVVNRTAFVSSNNSSCTTPLIYNSTSTPMATSNGGNPLWLQGVHSSVHQNASQPMTTFVGNTVPSQRQTYSQAIPQSIYGQTFQQQGNQGQNDSQFISQYAIPSPDSSQGIYQYGNQSQNSSLQGNLGVSVTDLDFTDCNWVNTSSPNIQQPPIQQPPIQQPPIQQPPIQQPPVQQPPLQQPPFQQPPIQQPPIQQPPVQQPPIQQPPVQQPPLQPPFQQPPIRQPPIEQPQFQQPPPIQQQPPIELSEIQSTEPVYEPAPVNEQSNKVANFNGLEFESWLLETQYSPAESNNAMASHLNMLSPEPTFIDSLVFDFETPWNGLAQV
ncbi:uncharacterized protein LOC103961418 [Pyrus x bretschneideri]|uniref:uncharacterized protein LOC103961418 n=1 Tax=Pyrus x bretschneideri TaxID=225117 RepID=UPI00202EAD85|nr:uncharacterized protein LOC103961418 [Pyrus x bretschneideri]